MAENVVITAGTGTTIHADEYTHGTLGSGKTQMVKLVDGTLESDTAITVDVGAKANALRVAPANDITDGTYIGDIKFGEGLPANTGVDIGDVDVTSIVPGTGATNLGKLEDAAHSSGDVGVMALAVRQSAQADFGADGDYVPMSIDDDGALRVAGAGGGTQYNMDVALGDADTTTLAGVVRDDALGALAAEDGDITVLRVSATGALHVTGGGGGTEYNEDAATPAPIVGTATLVERDDALAGLTPVEGDWATLYCDANGALWTHDNVLGVAVDGNYLNTNMNIAGTDCVGNAGVLAAGVLRVTIATDDECNNFLGTIDTDTSNMVTALQLLDNAVYVDDANWTDNTSSHLLVGGVYQSAPHTVTDGDVSPFQLDVNGQIIEANSAAILTALQIIDDWDDSNFCNVNLNLAGTDAGVGESALDGTELRVTIATDDDGVAHLSTIAGAVSATHMQCDIVAGTVTTVSTVTNLSQLNGTAITMDEGVHDGGCQRVTIATDDDGVAHLATIAGDTTNIETAIQIIDDWDATHASAAPADGAQVMGAAYSTALPTDVGADADAARLVTDRYGRLCAGLQPQAAKATLDNADTTTAREVVAATASRKIYVTSLILSVDTAGNYWLEDGDATQVTGKFYLAVNGGVAVTFPEGTPLNTVTVNKALNVKGSTTGNVSVTVTYYLAV